METEKARLVGVAEWCLIRGRESELGGAMGGDWGRWWVEWEEREMGEVGRGREKEGEAVGERHGENHMCGSIEAIRDGMKDETHLLDAYLRCEARQIRSTGRRCCRRRREGCDGVGLLLSGGRGRARVRFARCRCRTSQSGRSGRP